VPESLLPHISALSIKHQEALKVYLATQLKEKIEAKDDAKLKRYLKRASILDLTDPEEHERATRLTGLMSNLI